MEHQLISLELNKGLDLVTPPLSVESGSLKNCLNYELTDISGIRRIDGYERYDGYPNGSLFEFYRIKISKEVATSITPGTLIARGGGPVPYLDVAVILEDLGDDYYAIAALGPASLLRVEEYFLLLADGESFLTLQSGDGLLRLAATGGALGDTFIAKVPGQPSFEVKIESGLGSGKDDHTPDSYIQKVREYAALLRASVQDAPGTIAGLHWYKERLLAAVDVGYVTVTAAAGSSKPAPGTRVRWNGKVYKVLKLTDVPADSGYIAYKVYILPIASSGTVDDNLVQVNFAGTASTVFMTNVGSSNLYSTSLSEVASLGYYNNPNTSFSRGFTYLPVATTVNFTGGTWAGGGAPYPTVSDSTQYYIKSADGTSVMKVYMSNLHKSEGSWTSSTAAGTLQLVVTEVLSGNRDYFASGDQLYRNNPSMGGSPVLTLGANSEVGYLAGTGALEGYGTKYVWGTYNFYGQSGSITAYGATGAGRAFWANEFGYGMITAMPDAALDRPKYIAYHEGRLALGYAHGSVLLSVIGEPGNFSGVDGAGEIATGDDLAGLLELPGESLGVFGRRSIRKITGVINESLKVETIAANAGCIDYTAQIVGQTAVYTGVNGISTLEQTAAYGDFIGQRVSDSISTWLRPRLVKNRPGMESAGAIGATVSRSKGQYRLFLASGDVVMVTFTENGPKCTLSNYSANGQERVPYCWSSQLSDDGVERIHARWAAQGMEARAFELDSGWGFDGRTFPYYAEMSHVFAPNSANSIGVERVRAFGQGFGSAGVHLRASGIEEDFRQEYSTNIRDLSLPRNREILYDRMTPVTNVVDHANRGLGVSLRLENKYPENSLETEPSHIFQVLVLHVRAEGAKDA